MYRVIYLIIIIDIITTAHVHLDSSHHSNHHGHREPSKERVQDGHYVDSVDGKKHNPEYDHQMILGSKKEAQEFDKLSDEESKKRLKIMITRKPDGMDRNGDNHVDMIELIDWILMSFKKLTLEDGYDRFHDEDLNKDGFVEWYEHLKDNFDMDPEETEENLIEDPENRNMIREDRGLWKAADVNHDGKLDLNEFPAFNTPEEFDHMKDVLYELTMDRRDKDRNGYLSLNEFLVDENNLLPDSNSDTFKLEKERFSQDYDVNGDGQLNKIEVLKWIIPDNQLVLI